MTPTTTYLDDPTPVRYAALLRDAARTGRCPVLLDPDALDGQEAPDRPDDVLAAVDALDAHDVLSGWWPGPCLPGCPCGEALPTWLPDDPGVASSPDLSRDPSTLAAASRLAGERGLVLVDATRPADVPAVLDWSGICNYHPFQDVQRISAVLRHWERRWGAMLVGVTRSRLELAVAHPPISDDECRRVAAEHFAFCPDQQDPQNGDFYTLTRYAAMVRGAPVWNFWWD